MYTRPCYMDLHRQLHVGTLFHSIAVALANHNYKLELFHHFDHVMHADSTNVPVLSQQEFLNMFHQIGTNR